MRETVRFFEGEEYEWAIEALREAMAPAGLEITVPGKFGVDRDGGIWLEDFSLYAAAEPAGIRGLTTELFGDLIGEDTRDWCARCVRILRRVRRFRGSEKRRALYERKHRVTHWERLMKEDT